MLKSVTFETLEGSPRIATCSICGENPATLKCSGTHDGDYCLPCACDALANLANGQWTTASNNPGNTRRRKKPAP